MSKSSERQRMILEGGDDDDEFDLQSFTVAKDFEESETFYGFILDLQKSISTNYVTSFEDKENYLWNHSLFLKIFLY